MTDTYVVNSKGQPVIVKDPNAVLDYSWDWTDWLDQTVDRVNGVPQILVTGGITAGTMVRNGSRGTGIGYKTNAAAYAVGATVITLSGGTGTVLDTDLVSVDGDLDDNGKPRLYALASGNAAPGAITLAAPGLLKAIPAVATAVKIRAVVTSMLSAGVAQKPLPSATCRLTSFQGRTDDRTIYFKIQER